MWLYSRPEIRALLQAISRTRQNTNATIHPDTFRTMLIFFYGTGATISEAIALLAEDVDLKKRSMRIRLHGRGSPRTLPIGPDLWRILNGYSKWKASMSLRSEWFLVRRDGSCLNKNGIYRLFRMLLREAGVARRDRPSFRPRIRDFRADLRGSPNQFVDSKGRKSKQAPARIIRISGPSKPEQYRSISSVGT